MIHRLPNGGGGSPPKQPGKRIKILHMSGYFLSKIQISIFNQKNAIFGAFLAQNQSFLKKFLFFLYRRKLTTKL